MADVPGTPLIGTGHTHTNGLHWEGFPRLLWESLQLFCYTEPPQYDCFTYTVEGVICCTMKMTIPQHPFRAHWQPIEIEAYGYRFADTIEAAALEAITTFCKQHPNEVAEYPIGLFPAVDYHDPEWSFRVEHCAHLLGDSAGDMMRTMVSFMSAQLRHQELQRCGIVHLASEAQVTHSKANHSGRRASGSSYRPGQGNSSI